MPSHGGGRHARRNQPGPFLHISTECDLVAAEDTRYSGQLLKHFGISKPLLSYFQFNEAKRSEEERLTYFEFATLLGLLTVPLALKAGSGALRNYDRGAELIPALGQNVMTVLATPVLMALGDVLQEPLFIESVRIAPFKPRGTDVNVVLDLMIHDIEIIQHIIKSPVERVDAIGHDPLHGRRTVADENATRR